MARQLNPKSKEKIIKNAIDIMHNEGYQALSMRKVARKSNMVVGNVYRYFRSKDELVNEIFRPVYEHLNSFLNMPFEALKIAHPSPSDIKNYIVLNSQMVSIMINDLLNIHFKELQIIFSDSSLSSAVNDRVSQFLESFLKYYFPLPDKLDENASQLLKMFSRSLIAGIIEAINHYPRNKDNISVLINNYLSIYANLLEIKI